MRQPELPIAVLNLCAIAANEPNGLPVAASELMEVLGLDEAETDFFNNALLQLLERSLIEAYAESGGQGGVRFIITKVTDIGLREAKKTG